MERFIELDLSSSIKHDSDNALGATLGSALAWLAQRSLKLYKWLIYGTLIFTTSYFFWEDFNASAHTFRDGIRSDNIIEAFATFTDSFSWLILLLIFELKTNIIPDERLKGGLNLALNIISILAYVFIVRAFFGYQDILMMTMGFEALGDLTNFCTQAGAGALSLIAGMDDYSGLSYQQCAALPLSEMLWNPANGLIGTPDKISLMNRLAWTDTLNAGSWLLVVAILEADIILQLGGGLTTSIYRWLLRLNLILYAFLFIFCVYWFWLAQPVDGLDALGWLLAFFLIEMNILQWRAECRADTQIPYADTERL